MTHGDPLHTLETLGKFSGEELTTTLSEIEKRISGLRASACPEFLSEAGAAREALAAAAEIKRMAGQINVAIHALGILLCLPHILGEDEVVEYVSLGAGNTGREFDLETNHRIAEFKFIRWHGGPESIRQNSIFKDFFLLAESAVEKEKYLYVLGTEHPLKFFNGMVCSQSARRFWASFVSPIAWITSLISVTRTLGVMSTWPAKCVDCEPYIAVRAPP